MGELYDLIIIGAGPAGLTAGIYAQRAKLDTLLIDKSYVDGGQVINTYEVDNYPGMPGVTGFDLGEAFGSHAAKLGLPTVREEVTSVETEGELKAVHTTKDTYRAKTLLIATGARHRELGIPGEKALSGMGVSYCATCDGAFFKEQTVAVAGGGDVAVEDAIFLARGCKKVYVIHRRDELRAAKILQEKLLSLENVEMVWDHTVVEITGKEQVDGIRVENVHTHATQLLDVSGVFIAVGISPNSEKFEGLLEMDQGRYIAAGEDCCTNVPGIFAAGDVRTKMLRQIITAAADGANGVTSVQQYLMGR